MSVAYEKRFYTGASLVLTGTDAVVYTVPALSGAIVRGIYAHNPTGGGVTLNVNLRASGVAVADSNQLVEETVASNGRFALEGSIGYLAQGGVISAKGASLNIWVVVELV